MTSHGKIITSSSNAVPLCLKCRLIGHSVSDCPAIVWQPSSKWIFSEGRKFVQFPPVSDSTQQLVCQRCQALNILQLLQSDIPWQTKEELDAAARNGHLSIHKLGKTGSVCFRSDCSVCWCLWALTPNPSSAGQEILLFPDWTINRLSGALGSHMEREEKRQYAKCVLVGLEPDASGGGLWERANSNDALCILSQDDHSSTPLSGRRIMSGAFNQVVVEEWISACSRQHGDLCHAVFTKELEAIRLVNIETRQIVQYSASTSKYAALSYVWGSIDQQNVRLGADLGDVPATIEDAMYLVKSLGIKYLWVDSLCIEQSNNNHKIDQINRMWSIYRGATLTVIALSGLSADAGFQSIRKDGHIQPQLTCSIGGTNLVGLMPTLEHQIWQGPWGLRAWTLQEAILSPRCLYVSDHQLYFECEAMQCCESLDQKRSWAHNLHRGSATDTAKWQTWVMDETGSGCLRNPLDSPENRIMHWAAKVSLYCYRSMTNDEDGLNAFNGILQRLQVLYKEGFYWGTPVEDLQWGLLWVAQTHPPPRRPGFPTWSWAGSKVALWFSLPQDLSRPHQYPIPLRAWKVSNGSLVRLLDIDFRERGDVYCESFAGIDPLRGLAHVAEHEEPSSLLLPDYEKAEKLGYLIVEAVNLALQLDFSNPRPEIDRLGMRLFDIAISGVNCLLKIVNSELLIHDNPTHNTNLSFLLLARDVGKIPGYFSHYILVVSSRGGLSERKAVFQLIIPEVSIGIISVLEPQKQKFILI